MHIDPRIWVLLITTASGCYSASIGRDVERVRELTQLSALTQVADRAVAPGLEPDARALLGAPLDAEAAVRLALLNNRELRASLRELGIARGGLIQAGVIPNPVVEGEVLPERNTTLELRVEYEISAALLAPVRARAAKADLEAERQRVAAWVVELGYRVRAAFYALLSAEQRLEIGRQVLAAGAASREAARALLQAGNVPALDARTEEAAFERARIELARTELEVADRREALQRLFGLHGPETGWRSQGELPEAPARLELPGELESSALEHSLELAETRSRLDAVTRRIDLSRAMGWVPDVAIDFHTLYGNPELAPGMAAPSLWRFGGGLRLTLPIFDRKQGVLVAQKAELDGLAERYLGAAIDVRSAARQARNRLLSAHTRARQYAEVILPAQEQVMEETLLQYNAMQLGVFQLLQARRDLLQVRLAEAETLREYWTARAAMDALMAGRRVSVEGAMDPPIGAGADPMSRGH